MNCVVVVAEALFKVFRPLAVQLAQALSHIAVELAVRTLLRAAFHDHIAKLNVLPFRNLELKELVNAFLKVQRRHDGEVDGPSKVDQVGLGAVMDLELLLCVVLISVVALVGVGLGLAIGI